MKNNMIQTEPLISIDELAKELGMNKFSIYHNIRLRRFPEGIKIRGRRLFRKKDIESYFDKFNLEYKIEL